VEGNLTGYGPPTVSFSLLSSPASLTLSRASSNASGSSYSGWTWVSAGSAYSFSNPLPGSNGTLRWESSSAGGSVSGASGILASYFPQSAYLFSYSPATLPASVQGALAVFQGGAQTAPAISPQPSTVWLDYGSAWSAAASISVDPGTRLVSSGPSSGTVGQASSVVLAYQVQYLVTTVGGPSSAGYASPGTGWYDEGATVNLSATANTGWEATGWIGTGEGSYTGAMPDGSFVLTSAVTEVASFEPGLTITASQGGSITYVIGMANGTVQGGSAKTIFVPLNSTVSIFAEASSFAGQFQGWSGDVAGSSSSAVIKVSSPASVEGTFGTSVTFIMILGAAALVLVIVAAFALLRWRAPGHRQAASETGSLPPASAAWHQRR
jgi:hypothetical protein